MSRKPLYICYDLPNIFTGEEKTYHVHVGFDLVNRLGSFTSKMETKTCVIEWLLGHGKLQDEAVREFERVWATKEDMEVVKRRGSVKMNEEQFIMHQEQFVYIRRMKVMNGEVYHVCDGNDVNQIGQYEIKEAAKACVIGWLRALGWDNHDAEAEWERLWKDMIDVENIMKERNDGLDKTRDDGDGYDSKAGSAEDCASGEGPCREDGEEQSAETAQVAQKEHAEKIARLMEFSSRYLILDFDLDLIRGNQALQDAIDYACYLSLEKDAPFLVVDTEYEHSKKVKITYPQVEGNAVAGIYIPNNYWPSDESINKLTIVKDHMLNASRQGHPWPWIYDALAGGEWPPKPSLEYAKVMERRRERRQSEPRIAGSETHARPVYNLPSEDPDFVLLWQWESKSSGQILRAFDRQDNEGTFPTSMLSVVYELEASSISGSPVRKILSSEQADRWVMIYVLEWTGMEESESNKKIIKGLNSIFNHHDVVTDSMNPRSQR